MTLASVDPACPDLSELVTDHDDVTAAGDPGTELLDLPDDLVLTPDLAGESDGVVQLLDAPLSDALSVAAATAAAWTEYEWASWMAQVLRDAGVPVIEYPSWATRGRPRSVGRFQPRGVMWHHDASPKGPSPYVAKFCAETGRPAEGIPAPLAQTWVCDGCNAHAVGTWHILAAGRANHAGTGSWGSVGTDQGNSVLIGVETDNTTGEPTPPAMYASLVKGTAALMKHMRSDPARLLVGHKEYAPGRKNDPDDIDMPRARVDVARAMAGTPAKPTPPPAKPGTPAAPALVKFPGRAVFQLGKRSKYTTMLGEWLIKAGYGRSGDANGYQASQTFTEYDRKNVALFQRSRAALKGSPDGYPGPLTWAELQKAAAAKK